MAYSVIYMTAGSRDAAQRIGRVLVEERLAACVNILGEISSVYRWQGKVVEDGETAFIAKTQESLVPHLTERVRDLHDYDCPCVVSLSVCGGNPEFLDWIGAETGVGA